MPIEPDLGDARSAIGATDADGMGDGLREPMDRRRALKRLGLAAGAAWATPAILDSFASPVGAAAPASALLCDTPGAGMVTVPNDRVLHFDIGGGGGGGGSKGTSTHNGGAGGDGIWAMGTIAAMGTYQLTISVGMGGTWTGATNGGPGSWDWYGVGGAGYRAGGDGGDNGSSSESGTGGGGGGASAVQGPDGILLVASGGGGGGGNGNGSTSGSGGMGASGDHAGVTGGGG